MKSALELAMDRFGGEAPSRPLSDDQKRQLAEIDNKFEAKIAEAKIRIDDRLQGLPAEQAQEVRQQLAVEIIGFNEARERAKEKLRGQFSGR